MPKRVGIEGSHAVSEAVRQCDVDVIAAYPITPQTHIVEKLSEYVVDYKLDAEYIPVESEHSALSVCLGAVSAGARAFTCTSSQGLALMIEIVYIASSMRFPMVMVIANRSLSAPLSIWNDHSDAMMVRDVGWIQVFARNAQEAYDHVILGYKVSENPSVLLPYMIHMDGFVVTHVIEPVIIEDDDLVKEFTPHHLYPYRLHPDNPVTLGAYGLPNYYTEVKVSQNVALVNSREFIDRAWKEWEELTGRRYSAIDGVYVDDAEVVILTAGSVGETAETAVSEMRKSGRKVGHINLRLWRPFPHADLRRMLKGKKLLIVVDRALSYGGPDGPMASEIRSSLYLQPDSPRVVGFVAGLGGREVRVEDFIDMVDKAESGSYDSGQQVVFDVRRKDEW